MAFPSYIQPDQMACGATCLRMIAKYYGKSVSAEEANELANTTREGASMLGISEAAEKMGFRTFGARVSTRLLLKEVTLPCIAHWNQNHFVVIHKISKRSIYIADPAHGLLRYSLDEFEKSWSDNNDGEGVVLQFENTPEFYSPSGEVVNKKNIATSFTFLSHYFKIHKRAIIKLLLYLMAGSLLQLIFPFLTQSIVDKGIRNNDLPFIYLILLGQLMVFFGRTSIEIIRSYILIHVSTRINISMVSDFFAKLMRLPIAYFDVKMTGDIMQRIFDNHRVENFLTGSSLNTLFSVLNFIVFSAVLAWYNMMIFGVFLLGSIFYFVWIMFFMKRRAALDYKRFQQSSVNHSNVYELISGMQEIKLHNAEQRKRWQWEAIQLKLFKINLKGLSLTTAQNSGSALINELKNIIVTFLTAKLVIDGQVTLGMMLSISYINGQLNAPIMDMVNFMRQWQDAKLSLERLAEIHNKEDEEANANESVPIKPRLSLNLKNVFYKYNGAGNSHVLINVNCTIPANKITAIVGASGSGKTTLLKLLLKFYKPTSGEINLGTTSLSNVSPKKWREKCGVVMQEGYIFSDTIARNIAVGEENIDLEKVKHAAHVANIKEYIEELPLGYNTKIGMEGSGLSTGQKQRILIARAVYKDPEFLFFDEATSALDANNEKVIIKNLNDFFKNRTVVVIAHRLSTVKNADQILVLDNGELLEYGSHKALTTKKGAYYELVKNQLELGA